MKYDKIVEAIFIERPNRFIARVKIDGAEEVELVHVKNTGRCRELLLPGAEVILEDCIEKNPNRKTRYDLIAVKKNGMWVNIDSQAPNKVVKEWLIKQGYDCIKPEYAFGNSRMDLYMEKGKQKYLMEVKGCTLEIDGVGYFPDALTERGVKQRQSQNQTDRPQEHFLRCPRRRRLLQSEPRRQRRRCPRKQRT